MAIELTDEDYGNIDAAMKCIDGRVGTGKERVYLAGLSAGYRRGIEDAAKCCDLDLRQSQGEKWERACIACAAAIRALAE